MKLLSGAIVFVVLVSGLIWWMSRPPVPTQNYDQFAQCLAEKKLTMYGASWCSHCQNEKKPFGDSFKYVPYVECPDNTQVCLNAGINGYPTWIDADGKKYEGEQGLPGLSKISDCELPSN